jgi:RHS repeat-associated protein
VTEYNYDAFGNPNKLVDSRGNATTAAFDASGRMGTASSTFTVNGQSYTLGIGYTYDKEGRTTKSLNSRGQVQLTAYDDLGRVTSTTDILGNVTTYRRDIQDASIGTSIGIVAGNRSVITRVDEVTMPDNTPGNSADNPKMIRKYDQANRLVAEISATGLETRYVYDELGRLIETVVPDTTPNDWTDNPVLKREYTAGNRLKAQTDIFGNWERYVYNDLGQLASTQDVLNNLTAYTYNKGGQIETMTDPRNRTTRYRYDDKARLQEALFFDGSKYSQTYDELGRMKTETNELGQTTTYEYDAFSQVKAVINALNERTEFEYNDRRKLVRVTDALGHSTRYKYDEYANQVETKFEGGATVSMGYDTFGRMTSMTDERQFTTQYRYNNLSQLTEIEQPNTAKTQYTYDTLGRMAAMTDANQRKTEFEYDAFNRVVADKLPMGQLNKSVYNKYGQMVAATDFNNDTINYQYDGYGRLNRKSFTDARISAVTYTYDDVTSQLKTVTDGRGITAYDYDGRDRLAKITQPDTQYVQYGYDLLDNVTSVKTKVGTTNYSYDALNRLDLVKDGTRLLADYDYDAAGNHIQTKFADSSVETLGYDGRNRLTSVTTKNVVGTVFSSFNYVLDAAGNRTKVTENNSRVVEYQYDSLNRLTQEKMTDSRLGNRTADYVYDLVGNRMSKADTTDGTTTYVYDANDRLVNASLGGQTTQFTYDNNGSMKTRSSGTQTVTYDWINDGENRLIGASDGTSQTQFVYDAFGKRVATIDQGTRTNYLSASIWGLPEVLMEYDASGNITADYTQGMGTVRSRRDNREVFHHTDGLGSTVALTDTVGLVTDRYTYDAYGVMLEHQGTFGNSFQFAGEQRDSSTGLDYLRARYYDSSLGRFTSSDPYSGSMGDPMSLHNYQYANANPTRYVDPSGYFSSLGEAVTTISLMATIVSIYSSLYSVASRGLTGEISPDQVYGLYGDWVAGYGHGVSGGLTTDLRSAMTGEVVPAKDDFLWQMGLLAGVSTSFIIGFNSPTVLTANIGAVGWFQVWGVTTAGYGAGKGIEGLGEVALGVRKWEQNDWWNLLSLLPIAGMAVSTSTGLRAARSVREGAAMNDAVRSVAKTETSLKGGGCFAAGTEILTTDGLKKIEDIHEGDWVLADDPTTGKIEAHQVVVAYERQVTQLTDIYVDGEVISATEEHPIWVVDKGWVEPKDLQVGDKLQTEDGHIVDVDRLERREGDFKVYNFRVEGIPTYFVSGLGILVHNNDVCPGTGAGAGLPDMNGQNPNNVKQTLTNGGFKPTSPEPTDGGWQTFKHPDGSKVDINWNSGRIVRSEAPIYADDGSRINKGQRLAPDGTRIPRGIPHDQHPPEFLGG